MEQSKNSIVVDISVIPDGWSLEDMINCYEKTGFIIIDSYNYNKEYPPVKIINKKNKIIDMNKDEFYRELMLRLADNEEREDIEDCIKQAKEFFGDDIPEEEIEDITKNPDNPASLDDAVTKLGFELSRDRGLYNSYQDALARHVFGAFNTEDFGEDAINQIFADIQEGAERFLDDFISKTQNDYTVDNRNMTKE